MEILHLQAGKITPISVQNLVSLERSGQYEAALAAFGENWQDADFLPETASLVPIDGAEMLLRFGGLIGFAGYRLQLKGAQERSKNILMAARESFNALGDASKVAECETYIALGYWRAYEYREADTWTDEALSHDLPDSSDARLYALVIRSMIYLSQKRYEENLDLCLAVESDMRQFGDAFLNGSLSTNIGLTYKNLGLSAEAMRYLTLARVFHERSKHKTYLGTVQNNLAQLYKEERRFELAHESADRAIKLYRQVKDLTREASTVDTKAQIYLEEGKLAEALATADRSVAMLKNGEIFSCIAESLMTRSKALLLLDNMNEAIASLIEAVDITRLQNSESAAKMLIDEFSAAVENKINAPIASTTVDTGELKLVLPPSISTYQDYKGIWIHTSHLEKVGIPSGSLAVIVPGPVDRGDLIALSERETGEVSCGFYDAEFGIVCLERCDDDPLLFDQEKVDILGKIIGVCSDGQDPEGKMTVEALKL